MLSTITIISVFTEIFAAGILISGGLTFLHKYFVPPHQRKDLFLSGLFLTLFAFLAATLASQLMFNLGRPLAELIAMQKWVSGSLLLSSLLLLAYIVEKFNLRWGHLLTVLLLLVVGYYLVELFQATANLVYREEIIEPVVDYSTWIPAKPLLSGCWMLLAGLALWRGSLTSGGKKVLFFYTGGAALLFLGALLSAFYYTRFAEAGYLLAAWLIMLLAVLALLLGDLIPPETIVANRPLRFLRTRILFKLVLIFVLLIVILFEVTTLVTLNISKNALSQTIRDSYFRFADNIAQKVSALPVQPKPETLQAIIEKEKLKENNIAFIVDARGQLLAHVDKKRALLKEDLSGNQGVAKLLAGQAGAAEFKDEWGGLMVGAYMPITKYHWGVVVEEPIFSAYFELRRLETNSLLFVIAGIVLTALTGIFFARSIERPIKELILGTEAVSRGELGYHINSSSADEIGRLAEAFNKMTKDLRDSQERLILSEKLASLGTMAAGMAHEIKNPLVSLRTFTQLLQQKWEDKEFRDKFSQIIPHEIERINRIAESLLKFGRPMKPELTKVDVNSLLEEVILLFESEAKKNNVRVTKKLATLPQIYGDAGQLSQVFVNVVKNAIEAMQKNGGEMIVKTDVGEVIKLGKMKRQGILKGEEMVGGEEEDLGQPTPVVFIEITDTGEGIAEENLRSLFDPFFTTKMTGTGMGLPITLRIIEEHKGSIKVRSKAGAGTTFIITLPQKS